MSETPYVVGLGSNLGDRLARLAQARRLLADIGELCGASSVYESEAVGGPPQGPFFNAALSLLVDLDPVSLLGRLLGIERAAGRIRRERWGPRALDLDLLWCGRLVIESADLTIPHPRLSERTFALRPLLDVVPEALDPSTGRPYSALLGTLEGPVLMRVCGPDDWRIGSHHAAR